MAKLASQVVAVLTLMLLMGITTQAVPVSFSNMLSPATDLLVHCRKDGQEALTRIISSSKEYSMFLPTGFYGTYRCEFAAAGRRMTSFDVINSRCNCNTYYGCDWVVRSDGFFCGFNVIYEWA